jgi:predicted  nucleic acid-binding Zn-ribbon protein
LKRSQSSSSPALGMDQGVLLTSKLEACEQSVKTLRQVVETLQDRSKEINVDASSLDSRILALQTQMKQLQLKVVGKGVQIVNKTFQSFDDVKAWVDLHLPNHCYGLFVDGVSIFEFFAAGHVDAEKTYSAFYSQHRTGFKSTFEARIASSVQN